MKPNCKICAITRYADKPQAVQPEGPRGGPAKALLTVVAEAPGRTELELDRPLIGASGRELEAAFQDCLVSRSELWLTNACLCRPPQGSMKAFLAKFSSDKKRGKVPKRFVSPIEACRPRLLAEVGQARALLLLGSYACQALEGSGSEKALEGSRGFPSFVTLDGRQIPMLKTVHPAFVLRKRSMTELFRLDVAKAVRMARGQLTWRDPWMIFRPTAEQLANMLADLDGRDELVSFDVETDGIEPTTAGLRCLGIGGRDHTACVPFRSVEFGGFRYEPAEQERVENVLRGFFFPAETDKMSVAHNSQFDISSLEANLSWFRGRPTRPVFDTILAHHGVYSEWRHNLELLSSQYTDAPAHKDVDHAAWTSDHELHKYCMLDVSVTSHAAHRLVADSRLVPAVMKTDTFLSEFCRQLHKIGMRIDRDVRDQLYMDETVRIERATTRIRELAMIVVAKYGSHGGRGMRELAEKLNPFSGPQVASILYDCCGIQPLSEREGGYTDSGEPAVSKQVLFALMDRGLPPEIEEMLQVLIDAKEALKLRGTYCTVEPLKDGRVHASWNPHVVVSGRLSCSAPNLMNVPKRMRKMYIPEDGHVFLQWDKAQLEARITAWFAGELDQIKAFRDGADIHKVNACAVCGVPSVEEVTGEQRQFTKTFVYAIGYLAGKQKAWSMIKNFRDKVGSRIYKDVPFRIISQRFDSFWNMRRNTWNFHARNRELWKTQGYLADPLDGRRRYFLDGEAGGTLKEEQANYLIQTTAASDVNAATRRLAEEFPWGFDGPRTGIVSQCHDALIIECRKESVERVAARGKELLDSELTAWRPDWVPADWSMPLPVDIQVGTSYGSMKELKK